MLMDGRPLRKSNALRNQSHRWAANLFLTATFVSAAATMQPNLILIVADDLGYGDLASFGHPTQEWNAIDRLAREGVRFTQWYAGDVFCTPSRAALLTGRHPQRSGVYGGTRVFLPSHSSGLAPDADSLPMQLKKAGYRTGFVGKWHLGINAFNHSDGSHLPRRHGFDFVGTNLPFTLSQYCDTEQRRFRRPSAKSCFLYEGDKVVEQPIELASLTRRLARDAARFVVGNSSASQPPSSQPPKPFFLFYSLPQPHVPMFNAPELRDTSGRGRFGDQVAELAWAVAQLRDALVDADRRRHRRRRRPTVVLFTSDNGGHREICDEGGHNGPFRGGKGRFWEGGLRVPTILWSSPSQLVSTSGVNKNVFSHLDIAPTFLSLAFPSAAGGHRDTRVYDGRGDFESWLATTPESERSKEGGDRFERVDSWSFDDEIASDRRAVKNGARRTLRTASPPVVLFFYCHVSVVAMRFDRYKIHFRFAPDTSDDVAANCDASGRPREHFYVAGDCQDMHTPEVPLVFDVESDPGETRPLALPDSLRQHVDRLRHVHEDSVGRSPDALLTDHLMHESLIPCCRPPYCICKH